MIQSLTGRLAHYKFLSASMNPHQVENDIFSVQITDLINRSQVVNLLKYLTSMSLKIVFKRSQLTLHPAG